MFTPLVSLHFNVDDETATVVDLTTYSPTLDFNVVGVVGTFSVTDAFGTAVITGGTIDISGGDTESAPFSLPLDTLNAILNGTYTLVYTPTFSASGVSVDQFVATDQVTLAAVNWADIFNEPGATNTITISGATSPGNNGVRTVESVANVSVDTYFTVSGTITSESGGSALIAFSVTYNSFFTGIYTYNGCDAVTPTANVAVYCNTTQFGMIVFSDTTVLPAGQVLDVRLWNISYPGNLTDPVTPPDVTSALASVTITTLATGTWTWRLTYEVTVTQDDGLIYTYTVQSQATEVNVTCTTLCSLRCGIDKLIQQSALAVNGGATANALSKPMALVDWYIAGATLAQECGNQTKFDYYATLIQQELLLAGVDCDCGCDGESSTGNHWINNAGFESQTEIAQLISDVTQLQAESLAAAGQIYAALGVTNVQEDTAQVAVPGTYFGALGYIKVKFNVFDGMGGTINLRNITTGNNVFTYIVPANTLVVIELSIKRNGTNDFTIFGSRINSGVPPTMGVINTSGISDAIILPNVQNTLQLISNSASTIWLFADIWGIKYPV